MPRDIMARYEARYEVGRTGVNAELDDALARIENMRLEVDVIRGALEDGGRDDLDAQARSIDGILFRLAQDILGNAA